MNCKGEQLSVCVHIYFQTSALNFDQVVVDVYLGKHWKDIFKKSRDPDTYLGSCQTSSTMELFAKIVFT